MLQFEGTTKNNGYYSVAANISHVIEPTTINRITISSLENTNDVTLHLNGTVANPQSLNYQLHVGDFLQMRFTVPTSEYPANQTAAIVVSTTQAMYYIEAELP